MASLSERRIPGMTEADRGPLSEEEISRLRTTVVSVREIDVESRDLNSYFLLLNNPSNREHFTGLPPTIEDLASELNKPDMHGLVGINGLGEAVGYAIVRDAQLNENDSWIRMFVVDNRFQRRRPRAGGESPGVGTQFLDKLVEWVFTTQTHDGRDRESLHAGVIMDVDGWLRSRGLFRGYGFGSVYVLDDEVSVFIRKVGETVKRDFIRFSLSKRDWEAMPGRQTLPPSSGPEPQ